MKFTVVVMALMAGISTALPVVISPNYIEARGTEDVAAKRSFVLPDTIRSVDFPRDVVDEFNKRNPIGTGNSKNSGNSFKREPIGTGNSKNSGNSFKREPIGTGNSKNSGNSFKREPIGTGNSKNSGAGF